MSRPSYIVQLVKRAHPVGTSGEEVEMFDLMHPDSPKPLVSRPSEAAARVAAGMYGWTVVEGEQRKTMGTAVLICGSRTWTDKAAIERVIFSLDRDTIVVHGAARGADTLADEAALLWGLLRRPYPADWSKDGKAAGPIRNQRMLDENQDEIVRVIAFRMPGESRGTDDMIRRAKSAGIPVTVIEPTAASSAPQAERRGMGE